MIVRIASVLSAEDLVAIRARIAGGAWADGRITAGYQSAQVKTNLQLPHNDVAAREAGDAVLRGARAQSAVRERELAAARLSALFNRYGVGMSFGNHVDNAVRQVPGTAHRLRTDVSATLFLSAPEEYDGGELIVEDTFGVHSVKLAAGTWWSIRPAASTGWSPSPVVSGRRLFSGSRAWFATMARGHCCSISIRRFAS